MVTYERLGDHAARAAAKASFGRDDLPIYRIDQADALISFGADFLSTWGSPVEFHRQYAAFRTPKQRRGQLTLARATYVGPVMTMTAAKCDEWVATTPGDEAAVALSVLNVLVKQGWVSRNSGVDLDALRKLTADFEPASRGAEDRRVGRVDHADGRVVRPVRERDRDGRHGRPGAP